MPDSKTPDSEIPDWVTKTPHVSYNLAMYATDGGPEQEMPLTRKEFIKLKRKLAKMRGYPAAESHASTSR